MSDNNIENDLVRGDKVGGDKVGGDKNVYVISDRVAREQPSLILNNLSVINIDHNNRDGSGEWLLQFRLVLEIENESEFWVKQSSIGFVYYAVKVSGEKRIGERLKDKIDLRLSNIDTRNLPYILQQQNLCPDKISFAPYDLKPCIVQSLAIYLSPDVYNRIPYEWNAALYTVAEDSAPVWYQISMTVSEDLLELIRQGSPKWREAEISKKYLRKERCDQSKPVVGLILLDSNE